MIPNASRHWLDPIIPTLYRKPGKRSMDKEFSAFMSLELRVRYTITIYGIEMLDSSLKIGDTVRLEWPDHLLDNSIWVIETDYGDTYFKLLASTGDQYLIQIPEAFGMEEYLSYPKVHKLGEDNAS